MDIEIKQIHTLAYVVIDNENCDPGTQRSIENYNERNNFQSLNFYDI